LETRQPTGPFLNRYREAAALLTGNAGAPARELVHWLEQLASMLKIPSLAQWGLQPQQVPALAAQSLKASSMRGNPAPLDGERLEGIIELALAKDD
jgi:alcohol dehydrogenase class IV